MPFFLPKRLIEFEYLNISEDSDEYIKEAEPYRKDMDFAFFAVNFGFSKSEYEELTPREINFLYKAYENRMVSQSYMLYNAVFTAMYNVNRPKNRRMLKLFHKQKTQKADMQVVEDNMRIVEETDINDGNWLERLYRESGIFKERG